MAELSSSLNGIKFSFIEVLLPKSIFQFIKKLSRFESEFAQVAE